MYRDGLELLMHDKVNFVMNHGALGDVVSSLPAVIHARRLHQPAMKMFVWVPPWQMDLVRVLLAPYGEFEVCDFDKLEKQGRKRDPEKNGRIVLNSSAYGQTSRNRVDMVDFAFGTLLDARPEYDEDRNYPTNAPLGSTGIVEPYVVVPVGATSGNKEFHAAVMEPILQWLLAAGYLPIIVGASKTHVQAVTDHGLEALTITAHFDELPENLRVQCIDMRDKTTLLELRDLCGHANAVVGLDGGTLHLAATTDVPIVYGCTHIDPVHRSITRFGERDYRLEFVTPKNLACAGCQSNWTLMFKHDFRFCAYGDNLCTKVLDPKAFIDALRKLGLH